MATVSNAGSTASTDSSTTRPCRMTGLRSWLALSHCSASAGFWMVGDASARSCARGATTSTGVCARPASMLGSASSALGPAVMRTPWLVFAR